MIPWTVLIYFFTFFALVGCGQRTTEQNPEDKAQESVALESWSGALSVGNRDLRIGFEIKTLPGGEQVCTMDVPDQGAKDIPVTLIKNDADSLSLSVSMLGATYKGRKVSGPSIEGQFSQNGMVLPLTLKPGGFELNRPQEPRPPFAYTTEDVVFRNEAEGAELSGTLTYPVGFGNMPKGSVPVVLMVTGSGSQDRNEEVFDHKPFLVIADFLARHGIASLRYDDRGVGGSKGPLKGITTRNNLSDAEAGIAYLRSLGKFGKVGVLGHSEGGTIAFMMGADHTVDFLISLAGGAADGIEVIVGQNEAMMQQQGLPQPMVSDYATALKQIYKDRVEGKKVEDAAGYVKGICQSQGLELPVEFTGNLEKCVATGGEWLTWFLGYDPSEAISKISCPVMALNGKLDLQVLSKDNIPVIRKHLPSDQRHLIKEYDSLNHLFQHCTLETALNYGGIEETISEEVLQDMVDWIDSVK